MDEKCLKKAPEVKFSSDKDINKNDVLKRCTSAQRFAEVLMYTKGNIIIGLEGEWGSGKTVFLDMVKNHLNQNDYKNHVTFNSWEFDYSENPFLDFVASLSGQIVGFSSNKGTKTLSTLQNFKEHAVKLASPLMSLSVAVPLAVASGDSNAALTGVVSNSVKDLIQNFINDTPKNDKTFKESWGELVDVISFKNTKGNLIIFIDELDRCKPTYAVDLLEYVKHAFSIPHVTFVFAVDRKNLEHSINGAYGAAYDSSTYLEKFFNVWIPIPPARFSAEVLGEWAFDAGMKTILGNNYQFYLETMETLVSHFNPTPRQVKQMIYRHISVYLSVRENIRNNGGIYAFMLYVLAEFDSVCGRKEINAFVKDRRNNLSGYSAASDLQKSNQENWLIIEQVWIGLMCPYSERENVANIRAKEIFGPNQEIRKKWVKKVTSMEMGSHLPNLDLSAVLESMINLDFRFS